MDNKLKSPTYKNFYNKFNDEVEKYIQNGASKPQAISIVSKKYNLSPYKVINTFYPNLKSDDNNDYKDIKTEEGSFVTLKNDSKQNHYEVININNKDAIVLRNTDTNEEIVASETELTPVITENRMNKINEAQYNVSINGLETENADTLSQIFSLASQAETSNSLNNVESNPMPMDVDTGMPMDMEDDVEFDQELPMDTDIDSMSMPMDDMPMDTQDDISMPMDIDEPMDTDMSMDTQDDMSMPMDTQDDISMPMDTDEPMDTDMSMEDMMDDGMYDDEIAETLRVAGINVNEAQEIIPGDDLEDIEDDGSEKGEQEKYAEEITEANDLNRAINAGIDDSELDDEDFEDEISEVLRLAGVELNEEDFKKAKNKSSEELEEAKTDEEFEEKNGKVSKMYHGVDTDTFGKEASEGAKCSITCESTVNKDKIKSIYETAKSMYAKKDVSEWNSLDRRYIEKLIKEGCSYATSTKMLMEAKKGK